MEMEQVLQSKKPNKVMEKLIHPLKPIYNKNSKILILGSFPSVYSRKRSFYYAHPQNRFWPVLEKIFNEKIDNKEKFLLKHHIALWDVIASCEITGSSDASIKNVKVNDINKLIEHTQIKKVLINGKKAYNLYSKYLKNDVAIECISLPSTSPANAKYSLDDLAEIYKEYLVDNK